MAVSALSLLEGVGVPSRSCLTLSQPGVFGPRHVSRRKDTLRAAEHPALIYPEFAQVQTQIWSSLCPAVRILTTV